MACGSAARQIIMLPRCEGQGSLIDRPPTRQGECRRSNKPSRSPRWPTARAALHGDFQLPLHLCASVATMRRKISASLREERTPRERWRAERERVRGIEPPCQAWEACALPLSYTRVGGTRRLYHTAYWSDNGPVEIAVHPANLPPGCVQEYLNCVSFRKRERLGRRSRNGPLRRLLARMIHQLVGWGK